MLCILFCFPDVLVDGGQDVRLAFGRLMLEVNQISILLVVVVLDFLQDSVVFFLRVLEDDGFAIVFDFVKIAPQNSDGLL